MASEEPNQGPQWRFVSETLLPKLELTELRRQQLQALDELYFSHVAPAPIVEMLENGTNEPFWLERTSLWQLKRGDELFYDVFMYGADSGTAFKTNTTEVVAEIVQHKLVPRDKDAGFAIACGCEERAPTSALYNARHFNIRDAWSWHHS